MSARKRLVASFKSTFAASRMSTKPKNHSLIGVFLIFLAMLVATLADVIAKSMSVSVSEAQLMFLRSVSGFAIVLAFMYIRKTRKRVVLVNFDQIKLHIIRSIIWCFSVYLMFVALYSAPIADVSVLLLTESLFVIPLAVFFLNEKLTRSRLWIIFLMLFGTTCILFQDLSGQLQFSSKGWIAALGAALLGAIISIILKSMAEKDELLEFLFYSSIVGGVVFCFPAILNWQPVSSPVFTAITVMSICLLVTQALIVQAFRYSDALVITPFFSVSVPFGVIAGWLVFSEVPSWLFWPGCIVVVFAALLTERE